MQLEDLRQIRDRHLGNPADGLPAHPRRSAQSRAARLRPRGASYSWYLYSANRVKNPLVRGRLMKVWRKMRETMEPIEAWTKLQSDPILRASYVETRGKGGFRACHLG